MRRTQQCRQRDRHDLHQVKGRAARARLQCRHRLTRYLTMKNTTPVSGLDRLHLSARPRITRPAALPAPLPRNDAGRLAGTRVDFLLDDLAPT